MPEEEKDDKSTSASSAEEGAIKGESPTPPQDDKSLSDVVARVAKESSVEEEPAAESSTETTEASPEARAGKEEASEERGEESNGEPDPDAELPFHNHPRWKEVMGERNKLREEAELLKVKAKSAESLALYCKEHGLAQDDIVQALELVTLAKKDTKAFRNRLNEYVEEIDIASGSRLPTDIQKKLDDGIIDEGTAKELAQLRVKSRQGEAQTLTLKEQQQLQLQKSVASAVDAWEEAVKKVDPDYDKRREELRDRIVVLWTASPPDSVESAISLVERANKEVKERRAKRREKPPVRKVLGTTNSSVNKGEEMRLDNLDTDLSRLVRHVANQHA